MILYLQPDRRIYVQAATAAESSISDSSLLTRLDQFAHRIQTLPPFFVYEMTKECLLTAVERGVTAVEVLSFFRQHVSGNIPVDVQSFVVHTMNEVRPSRSESIAEADAALACQIRLRDSARFRHYQREAIDAFSSYRPGSGVVVLPCGAGKTVVGIGVVANVQKRTLILVPNEASAAQWLQHLKQWTDISDKAIAIDNGRSKLTDITITTYQRLTARRRSGEFHQLKRYADVYWGLVIYDEVHLLPAPLFRRSADLRAQHRLGLSATLVREDGHAADIFGLVGPVLYQAHTDDLAQRGYLSIIRCVEIRIPLPQRELANYRGATAQMRHRIAADNSEKLAVIDFLCHRHQTDQVLIMGHYTDFLTRIADRLGAPMLSGITPKRDRLRVYDSFRRGELPILVLSRIANVAVDLPNADVAIQVSGLFGSRQEEAQRLGRLLRPKSSGGLFYSLVTEGTVEERTAKHRQGFLVEQGFAYDTFHAADMLSEGKIPFETE